MNCNRLTLSHMLGSDALSAVPIPGSSHGSPDFVCFTRLENCPQRPRRRVRRVEMNILYHGIDTSSLGLHGIDADSVDADSVGEGEKDYVYIVVDILVCWDSRYFRGLHLIT